MIARVPNLKSSLHIAGILIAAATALGGCKHTEQDIVTGSMPSTIIDSDIRLWFRRPAAPLRSSSVKGEAA